MKGVNTMAYLTLMRPANVVTSVADILAGYLVALATMSAILSWQDMLWLCLATAGLYGGGVALNDALDAGLDRIERPERPIPSGKISQANATWFALSLMGGGVFAASMVSGLSLIIAIGIAVMAILYNAWAKHLKVAGPLFMGGCRGANLLLGISGVEGATGSVGWVAVFSLLYIFAVTLISQGEVHGKNRSSLKIAATIYGFVILSVCLMSSFTAFSLYTAAPWLLLLSVMIFSPLFDALKKQQPLLIKHAVKVGVLSLIIFDAALVAGFSSLLLSLLIFLLLPISFVISRLFAVT
ncbi:UbiA-like protein EboC [Limibacter armeniacum]|uniref:UbiA-like protein EboC n=1 Tax=Limibacter armeniacum TaxID=466084 RepID=UPI002FE61CD6